MHQFISRVLLLKLLELELLLTALYMVRIAESCSQGQAPLKGHQIKMRGCEMIEGRGEWKKHKDVQLYSLFFFDFLSNIL